MFEAFVDEFEELRSKILNDIRFWKIYKEGKYAEEGKTRYSGGYLVYSSQIFSPNSMIQYLRGQIADLEGTRKIFDYVTGKKLWHLELDSFEKDLHTMPSITCNVIAGFIARNFQLNSYEFRVTDFSFAQSIIELDKFFRNDFVKVKSYLSIPGASGSVPEIQLDEGVFVKKVDFELARAFNLFYSRDYYIEMYEGDYVIEITHQIHKIKIQEINQIENDLFRKWFNVVLLSNVGNVEEGKYLRKSEDWVLVTIEAPSSPIHKINKYSNFNKSDYYIDEDIRLNFEETAVIIKFSNNIDDQILNSIVRLKKSKSSQDINDRVVELALALEYIINTNTTEVTYQLCLKAIKLYNENNIDEDIFIKLKKFYKLRSEVIHGNSLVKINQANKETIDYAENIVLTVMVKLIKFNISYTFKEISDAVSKSIYVAKPLAVLLESTKAKKI